MNTAILSSTIGGSAILIASVIGALMNHFFAMQRKNQSKIESGFEHVTASIHNLDTKFTGQISDLEVRLSDKFTGQISDLEVRLSDKFTGHLTDLRKEVYDGFKDHGERLARIEVELKIEPPPAEAA